MQLQFDSVRLSAIRTVEGPTLCPLCDDWMVAPIASEFVEGGEIRHMWECDACQESTEAYINLVDL
jgi:hypothetical protein